MEHFLSQPMYQWQNQSPYKQAQAELTGGLYAIVNRYPSTLLLIRFIRQYQIQHSLAHPMKQAKSNSPSKQACLPCPASVHIL